MANTQTFNYETESAEMERRRRVLEAMQGSALEPLQQQSAGGVAVPTHWTQGLAKMVQAYGARKGQEQLKTDREALATRYSDDLRTGMDAYQQTAEGSSTPNFVMQPGADGMPENAVMKGNPRKAVLDAIASNHPVLRDFGMSQFKKQGEGTLTPKDLAAYANPTDVVRNPMDPSKWQGKRDIGETGGTVYDKNTLGVVQLGGPQPKRIVHQGDVYEESPSTGGWKKLDNAPKVSLSNVGNTVVKGQNAGIEAWSKEAAKTVGDLAESARQSVKLQSQLTQLEALTQGGTAAGPLADAAVFIAGLSKQAGIPVDAAKLNNSQAFNSVATQAWAALMQQNGGARGLVKEESEKLAQSLPALSQTPEGRAQIIAVLRQAAAQNISDATLASKQYAKALQTGNLEEFTYGLSGTQLPQSPANPPAAGGVAPGSTKRVRLEDL